MKNKDFWNTQKAIWYQNGLNLSNLPATALKIILPRTKGCSSFLDIGSGCGTFAIPLAKAGKKVTALDPSSAMLGLLRKEIKKQKLRGIKTVQAVWGGVDLKPHDVIICANVPYLLKEDSMNFLRQADKFVKKAVFLIEGADPNADKFYYKDIYPLLFNKTFKLRADYLKTYVDLHSLGIFANVNIIEYDFDQPFNCREEALDFWKKHMELTTGKHDEKLLKYLDSRLEPVRNGLLARFHKKSAVIWWLKDNKGSNR